MNIREQLLNKIKELKRGDCIYTVKDENVYRYGILEHNYNKIPSGLDYTCAPYDYIIKRFREGGFGSPEALVDRKIDKEIIVTEEEAFDAISRWSIIKEFAPSMLKELAK